MARVMQGIVMRWHTNNTTAQEYCYYRRQDRSGALQMLDLIPSMGANRDLAHLYSKGCGHDQRHYPHTL